MLTFFSYFGEKIILIKAATNHQFSGVVSCDIRMERCFLTFTAEETTNGCAYRRTAHSDPGGGDLLARKNYTMPKSVSVEITRQTHLNSTST